MKKRVKKRINILIIILIILLIIAVIFLIYFKSANKNYNNKNVFNVSLKSLKDFSSFDWLIAESSNNLTSNQTKNTQIFAGIWPSGDLEYNTNVLETYLGNISYNIDGIVARYDQGLIDSKVVHDYHSKGYIVMAGSSYEWGLSEVVKNNVDMVTFDEPKWNGDNHFYSYPSITGAEFNSLKDEFKETNPDFIMGVVEPSKDQYDEWSNEGGNLDIIGLEQYCLTNGYHNPYTLENFTRDVAIKFPNAKTQVWINNISQISEYYGKVDQIVLYDVDNSSGRESDPLWPNFTLSDIKKELKKVKTRTLIAYYPFENNTSDATENGNDGTNYGATINNGKIGGGYNFNGVDNYIEIPSTPALQNITENSYTWSLWFNEMGLNTNATWPYGTLICKPGWHTFIGTDAFSDVDFGVVNTINSTNSYTGVWRQPINLNTWNYAAGVVDTVNKNISLYLNGALVGSQIYTGDLYDYGNYPIRIGECGLPGLNYDGPFNGSIDEVKIWNYALTNDDIRREYERAPEEKLIAYYPFEGNASDVTGNGNDGNNNGAVLTQGKIGYAYNFDGSGINSRIEIPNSNSLDFMDLGITLAAWINPNNQSGNWERIVDRATAGDPWDVYALTTNLPDDGIIDFFISNGTNGSQRVVTTNGMLPFNQWSYVVGTYNGSTMKIYVNGILNNSNEVDIGKIGTSKYWWYESQIGNSTFGDYQTYNVTIGSWVNYPDGFNGSVDEVRIWNYALNDSDILNQYNNLTPYAIYIPPNPGNSNSGSNMNSNPSPSNKNNIILINKTAEVGSPIEFFIPSDGLNQSRLNFSVKNLPNGATFDIKTGRFSWVPAIAGEYIINFSVSDKKLTDIDIVTISVNEPENASKLPSTPTSTPKPNPGTIIFWIIVIVLIIIIFIIGIFIIMSMGKRKKVNRDF